MAAGDARISQVAIEALISTDAPSSPTSSGGTTRRRRSSSGGGGRSGMRIKPLTAVPLGTITSDQNAAVAANPRLRFCGFAVRENAGTAAAAEFVIKKGATVAGGTILYPVTLAADGSDAHIIEAGIECPDGISIDHVSGSVDLVLFTRIGG